MPDYAVFGGCLRADLTFPELCETAGVTPDWTLRMVDAREALPAAECLGTEAIGAHVTVRSFARPSGWRIAFDDTGTFDVSRDGRDIAWCPGAGATLATLDAARIDLVGRVLAMAMHAAGMCCLHGSSVALGDTGVAFVAPKYHGKSTLAIAIARAGGRLMNDDTVPIDLGPPVTMRPGAHRVRLWSDAVERLGGRALRPVRAADDKYDLARVPAELVVHHPVPLAAIYLLAPTPPATRTAAVRARLAPAPSAIALVRHAKLGALLGKHEAVVLLDRAITLAEAVPVYALHAVRDFDRLDEVVAQVMAWHPCHPSFTRAGRAW